MKMLKSMVVSLSAILLPLQAFAAPAMTYDGTTVALSGTMDSAASTPVTVIITRPAADGTERALSEITEAATTSDLTNVIEYMGVIDPEDGGAINHTIPLSDGLSSGLCAVYVNQLGENTLTRIDGFDHVNTAQLAQLAQLVTAFNLDGADYSALLSEANLTVLSKVGAKKSAYRELTNQSEFQTLLKGYKPFVQTGNDSAAAYFVKSFNESIALAQLKLSARTTLEDAAYKGTYWEIDLGTGDFARLSTDKQNAVLSSVASYGFTRASQVDSYINEQIGISVLNELCVQRADVSKFLDDYSEVFGLTTLDDAYGRPLPALSSFDDYSKARIYESILSAKSTMTDKTGIQNGYRNAITDEMNDKPASGNNSYHVGSHNKGGGSGSSSVHVEVDSQQPYRANPFYDVADTHWAFDYINKMYIIGAVNGREDGSFCPDDRVSREELVKMLCGVLKLEPIHTPTGFADVEENAWYAPFIAAAVRAELILGTGNGSFGVGSALSRQDAAVILCRAAGLTADGTPNFTDSDEIAPYALGAVSAASAAGFINGYGDGSFVGTRSVTRAEISAMLCRLAEVKGE